MSNYPQQLLSCPIAQNGDKNTVPVTAQEAGTGRISQEEGWGIWNSRPIGEGGIPPKREDFNSVLNLLSSFIYWYQQGGVMRYSAETDYEPTNEVFNNGVKYRCLVANGPSSEVKAPVTNPTYWLPVDSVVRYIEQTLTSEQKAQARKNIDVYSSAEIDEKYSDVLRYSPQSLTEPQKQQSRTNIGVYSKEEVDDQVETATKPAVLYTKQELNSEQQKQARENIGVYSKEEVENKVEGSITEAVAGLSAASSMAVGIGSSFTPGINGKRITFLVFVSYFNNLYSRDFTIPYTCKVNGSSVGSISVRFHSQRTGGSGHGYFAAIVQTGFLNVTRTVNASDAISVTRDSDVNLQGGSIESEYAFITVS